MGTLAVTRPYGEGKETAQLIQSLGWKPFIFHTVELKPRQPNEIVAKLENTLAEEAPEFVVFMSQTGVKFLFEATSARPSLYKRLKDSSLVAVGPRTRKALLEEGVQNVLVPHEYSTRGILNLLAESRREGQRILLARSSEATDDLEKALVAQGSSVETFVLYEAVIPADTTSVSSFLDNLDKREFDAVLFTSAVSALNLFKITENLASRKRLVELLARTIVGAIGPVTSAKLLELGVRIDVVPSKYLIREAVQAIIKRHGSAVTESLLSNA